MHSHCISCGRDAVEVLLDLGPQPPSNRFLRPGEVESDRHPLVVGQCRACALVQLVDPMPVSMVKSRFSWLSYNEPEGHLDRLVDHLRALPGVAPRARIVGVTYKDDSTLARLARSGYTATYRLDPARDLGIEDPLASLETIQDALTPGRAATFAARMGPADVVIARHILEHAHDPAAFLEACGRLTRPGGLMVLEMPDSTKFLEACDYCFLWEEHIAYFTPTTIRSHCERNGFGELDVLVYPYPLEDSLMVLVRNVQAAEARLPADAAELARGARFGGSFEARRASYRTRLEQLRRDGRRIALFGAGHLAAKFVNLYQLADLVDCVVDDNPNKQSLRLPGSRLPVAGSSVLTDGGIDLCLLSLSPESEQKVVAAKQGFRDRGGEFQSIFYLSPLGMRT